MNIRLLLHRKGVSEVVGALTLTLITIVFMSLVASNYLGRSRSTTSVFISQLEAEQRSLMEKFCVIDACFNDGVTLWVFNNGKVRCELVEVLVGGYRFQLNPHLVIEPYEVQPLHLEFPWTEGSCYVFVLRSSSGGVFRYEVKAPSSTWD
ncbi:MAG: hypothetical protein DRJ98_01010 [Thermoprotei archaeon]|nr:MAG: hypothetical protein DRJ98_01010 [Thermoprotei archaeon]RLF18647.1 MAG: hypothetical protein DRN06_00835 [Thermoprotei archaeon]